MRKKIERFSITPVMGGKGIFRWQKMRMNRERLLPKMRMLSRDMYWRTCSFKWLLSASKNVQMIRELPLGNARLPCWSDMHRKDLSSQWQTEGMTWSKIASVVIYASSERRSHIFFTASKPCFKVKAPHEKKFWCMSHCLSISSTVWTYQMFSSASMIGRRNSAEVKIDSYSLRL